MLGERSYDTNDTITRCSLPSRKASESHHYVSLSVSIGGN